MAARSCWLKPARGTTSPSNTSNDVRFIAEMPIFIELFDYLNFWDVRYCPRNLTAHMTVSQRAA